MKKIKLPEGEVIIGIHEKIAEIDVVSDDSGKDFLIVGNARTGKTRAIIQPSIMSFAKAGQNIIVLENTKDKSQIDSDGIEKGEINFLAKDYLMSKGYDICYLDPRFNTNDLTKLNDSKIALFINNSSIEFDYFLSHFISFISSKLYSNNKINFIYDGFSSDSSSIDILKKYLLESKKFNIRNIVSIQGFFSINYNLDFNSIFSDFIFMRNVSLKDMDIIVNMAKEYHPSFTVNDLIKGSYFLNSKTYPTIHFKKGKGFIVRESYEIFYLFHRDSYNIE